MSNHQLSHQHEAETRLKEISPIHELAARSVAIGITPAEVAKLCNRNPQWVYQLNRSAVFKARVSEIQEQLFASSALPQQLEQNAALAANKVRERLNENASDISVSDLTKIIGQGTKQGGTTVHVSVVNAVAFTDQKNRDYIED